ncbi:Rne/Rng family ribonuclease [Azorhizobium doebereinerae]|uniref:Rne/Rng family ribonuclease n=1 Tax=Azorhizobium doebereinerae TaxID=281091 RepID=UPI00048C66EE|nr:ribonuclease E/G [Azorhizobium doebereinerae]
MANKMLIDATHPEETRVVVVRGNRVEEFDYESASRKQLRGNIYLAKVTRVEPSLQAAFIEYGGNRHGFLAFSEIHPDYYQIPVADRQALIEEEERAARAAEDEEERRERRRERSRSKRTVADDTVSEAVDEDADDSDVEEVEDDEVIDTIEDGAIISSGDEDDDEDEDTDEDDEDSAGPEPLDPETLPPQTDVAHIAAAEDHVTLPAPTADEAGADAASPVAAEAQPAPAEQPQDDATVEAAQAAVAETDDAPVLAGTEAAADAAEGETAQIEGEATEGEAAEGEPVRAREGREDRRRSRRSRHRGRKPADDEAEHDDADEEDEGVEQMGSDDALEEVPERSHQRRARTYKIQEVIRRRQVMLVQVVKEERGNKGAALTTYLSLAGRYSVLMPNTARGGGISRKITNAVDRKRLKDVVQDLEVPEGMGIILRTAGANRTKVEIKRDFEYLLRLWETVRELTLTSSAPSLVYEEGSLIKRAIRDLYSKEIDEIHVAGEDGFREARDFMRMLMPSHAKNVMPYREPQPIFAKYGVEHQLDAMFSPVVQLKSGGYIVINPTEALVSIDVNSGRATREHHIEDTALKTNMEASEEIARQLRLRDLAGLIVIDFIDMEEKRNNRSVERKLKDCLKNDRARIQVGRISHFGLMEMSRQRIRTGVLESSIEVCPTCGGTGHVRSAASVSLQLLRALEEQLLRSATHNLIARTRAEVALYVLNHKRAHLRELEDRFGVTLVVQADDTVTGHQPFLIDKGELAVPPPAAPRLTNVIQPDSILPDEEYEDEEEEGLEDAADADAEAETEATPAERSEDPSRKRRRRRRRRGEREGDSREARTDDERPDEASEGEDEGNAEAEAEDQDDESRAEGEERGDGEAGDRRRRRRGRRGGRRNRRDGEDASSTTDEDGNALAEGEGEGEEREPAPRALGFPGQETFAEIEAVSEDAPVIPSAPLPEPVAAPAVIAAPEAPVEPAPAPRRRSTVREKAPVRAAESAVESAASAPAETPEAPVAEATPEPAPEPEAAAPLDTPAAEPAPSAPPAKPRSGWWQRKLFGE